MVEYHNHNSQIYGHIDRGRGGSHIEGLVGLIVATANYSRCGSMDEDTTHGNLSFTQSYFRLQKERNVERGINTSDSGPVNAKIT